MLLANLLFAAECFCALLTLWRVNQFGQWPHGRLGFWGMNLMAWSFFQANNQEAPKSIVK